MKVLVWMVAALTLPAFASPFDGEIQLRARQLPGWDARAREGRCEIRVWVDNRAEVRMRGDAIFVRTLEGSKSRDEGSECSQPLPFNSIAQFQIRQISGRTRVALAQQPSRANNYTAMISINDSQGGGDNYAFEVNWRADDAAASAPAPFFDDVRACQDAVRQRFQNQNGRGSYIDFTGFADRLGQDQNRAMGRGRGQESIQGRGSARNASEARDITYSCVVETRQNKVVSGGYQFTGNVVRANDQNGDRRPLR